MAVLSIVGFLSVIFTYIGVNFVLSGLHSYGSS
jgi:ABC-type transport system involved in cytochrome c biogenesis permease subunit